MKSRQASIVFYVIVIAQFLGTSLWFGGNAVLPILREQYHWPPEITGWITSATQVGFIIGTLIFAMVGFADRFSPSRIFFVSSLLAAACNVIMLIDVGSISLTIGSRMAVGFFLAGIYPVGMKIASDWQEHGLGDWLGALVGALVLGTASPFLLRAIGWVPDVRVLMGVISLFCLTGGVLVLILVPDGPYRKYSGILRIQALWKIFRVPSFRAASLGYFGHMWELYAMWAFVPAAIAYYGETHLLDSKLSLATFYVIGAGGLGCYAGGKLSTKYGSASVATVSLLVSGLCCALSPWFFTLSPILFFSFMIIWGITAAMDSPQFSALVAKHAPADNRGSAITLVVCIGFVISVVTIQMLAFLQAIVSPQYLFLLLFPGPIFGVISMLRNKFVRV